MANLATIGEYEDAAETAKGFVTEQQVNYGAGVTSSSAFNAATRRIRVATDTDCRIRLGTSPQTATSTSQFLFAGQVEYFTVDKGAGWVISIIAV